MIDLSATLPERLSLLISEVTDGNMALHTGDDPARVLSNRAIFADYSLAPPHWLNQIHSTDIVVAEDDAHLCPDADGLYSAQGCSLAVLTADCLPIVLASASGDEYAVVHAGWKGLLGGVIENAAKHFRSPPAFGVIGPGIGQENYQVDQNFRDRFINALGESAANAFTPDGVGHYRADLKLLAKQKLTALGCTNIADASICSYSNPNLYSYRQNKTIGRFATVVGLANLP